MQTSQALISDFEEEAAHTRKVLEVIPEDHLDWKPHEKSMTLGQLASHIAETPTWMDSTMEEEFDFAAIAAEYRPYLAKNRSDLLETFEKNARGFTEMLAGRDDDFLAATWTMRNGDQVLMSTPRKNALRSIAIHHTAHHRGQLTVYLRLLGVAVPPTYGPTADNPSFH